MTVPMTFEPGKTPGRLAKEAPAPEPMRYDEFGWLHVLRFIRRRLSMILTLTLVFCLVALPLILRMEKTYYAQARVMLSITPATALTDSATVRLGDLDVTGEIERLASTENAEEVISRLELDQRAEFNPDLQPKPFLQRVQDWLSNEPSEPETVDPEARAAQILSAFQEALTLHQQGKTNVVTIGFTSRDRQLAAEVPAAVVEVYRAQTEARWSSEVAKAADWLADRVKTAQAQVDNTRALLEEADKAGRNATAESVEAALDWVSALESSGARLVQELYDIEITLASIEAAEANVSVPALSEPEELVRLRRELHGEMRELENSKVTFGENSEVVVRGRIRIAALRASINSQLAAYRKHLEWRQSLLKTKVEDLQRQTVRAREQLASQQSAAMERDRRTQVLEAQEDSLSLLEYQHQSVLAEGKMTPTVLDVLSPAMVPRFPVGASRKTHLLMVAVFGAVAALTLAGLRELLDQTVRSHEQVDHLAQLVPVGYLPVPDRRKNSDEQQLWPTDSQFGECLGRTVHLLETANHGEFPTSMLIFPASDGEECSEIARWMALDLHARAHKVLLVTVRDATGAPSSRAGSDISIDDIDTSCDDGVARLELDSGQAHADRFLMNAGSILTDATRAGYVTIFDSPPFDRLITLKLAQLVECRLFVMQWGRTARPTAELVAELSEKAGITPLLSLIVGVQPAQHSKYGFTDFITLVAKGRGRPAPEPVVDATPGGKRPEREVRYYG